MKAWVELRSEWCWWTLGPWWWPHWQLQRERTTDVSTTQKHHTAKSLYLEGNSSEERTSASKGENITGGDAGTGSLTGSLTGRVFWRGVSEGLRRYRQRDAGLRHGAWVRGECRRGSGGCIPKKKKQKSEQNHRCCSSLANLPQMAKRGKKNPIQKQKFRNIIHRT